MSPRNLQAESQDIDNVCEGDCCMGAVKRAYREMVEQGQPDQFAVQAARAVFAWHHPEVPAVQADAIVDQWVRQGAVH